MAQHEAADQMGYKPVFVLGVGFRYCAIHTTRFEPEIRRLKDWRGCSAAVDAPLDTLDTSVIVAEGMVVTLPRRAVFRTVLIVLK
jgi:hypothetical protein